MTSTQVLTHALSDSDMNQMMLDSFQADIWKNKVGGGGGGRFRGFRSSARVHSKYYEGLGALKG